MARRLTTNQEIAGSTPASVISSSSIGTFFALFFFLSLSLFLCAAFGNVDLSYQLNRIWGPTMNDTTRNEFTGYVCITQCQLLIFI